MKVFTLIAMIAAGLSISGCIYVPPVWDVADEIHKVGQIEEGITTKEDAEAQYRLSRHYFFQNEIQKFVHFRCLAANQGQPFAQFRLGHSYNFGTEINEPNFVQAHLWYALAASNGHSFSSEMQDRLTEQMTPEQIARGERMAAQWEPNSTECEFEAKKAEN